MLYIKKENLHFLIVNYVPKGTTQKKIDITPLSKAVYILKLQGKGIKKNRKLVKNQVGIQKHK